ncbi:MAG: single-stranded-DNA-specific exonuclease RecJ [Betaproteobacteria bacterium]|nr:MAG: single-stranded-DNA-specific exonuclease RecJ [Betaproteobacteria bacterium]
MVTREVDEQACARLIGQHVHPVLARIYAARGIDSNDDLDTSLGSLLPTDTLRNCSEAAALLADAIIDKQRVLIVADYDADGATACALGLSVLRQLGAEVAYLVPNRFEHGYGLTPEIVDIAASQSPQLIITVDNGIASVDGVARANQLGIRVLVTDHHLAGDALPQATCIVNPNQPGDVFPSKNLAGVGVMFYVLLALRAELKRRGWFADRAVPNLADQLDLVALGTVADVVRLDKNNRTLVTQGLKRIRSGRSRPGIHALFDVAGRDPRRASTYDLGFVLGPRLNAAGRLTDMTLGIECLLTTDGQRARELASQLDALNRERREVEAQMQASAIELMESIEVDDRFGLALFDPGWHHGVVGILASRLRERFHRPVIALAPAAGGEVKGSGRSIPGLHLRDALDLLSKRFPGLILRFGGHAMAAGLTIRQANVDAFALAFDEIVRSMLAPGDLNQDIEVDGSLAATECSLEVAELLDRQIWGQGFVAPTFCDTFQVVDQRVVGGRHRKLRLSRASSDRSDSNQTGSNQTGAEQTSSEQTMDAIRFDDDAALPQRVECVYRLNVNEFNGKRTPQLVIEHCRPA